MRTGHHYPLHGTSHEGEPTPPVNCVIKPKRVCDVTKYINTYKRRYVNTNPAQWRFARTNGRTGGGLGLDLFIRGPY